MPHPIYPLESSLFTSTLGLKCFLKHKTPSQLGTQTLIKLSLVFRGLWWPSLHKGFLFLRKSLQKPVLALSPRKTSPLDYPYPCLAVPKCPWPHIQANLSSISDVSTPANVVQSASTPVILVHYMPMEPPFSYSRLSVTWPNPTATTSAQTCQKLHPSFG